jgi:hypothetical protein
MKKCPTVKEVCGKILLAALLALCASARAGAQGAGGAAEREAVKRAVETYLYAEYDDEKKSPLHPEAGIFTVDEVGKRIRFTTILKSKARKVKGAKTSRGPQKVVSVEVAGNAAYAKVATDFSPEGPPEAPPEHVQFISLMKLGDEWKIVGILMPSAALAGK